MRPAVNDLYSITASHYINAGQEGLEHFNVLMNSLISDLNLFQTPEINSVYACILYKGHKKDKTSDRSYRTISTCPLLAKGLDTYLRQHQEADTQFQGEGSSHELAALLLTETIQHSLHTLGEPLYVLYLDARSAFDRVVIELLVRNLYLSGTRGHQLLFIKERLKNRLTFCEWDKTLMGPIGDLLGVEQGGVNSDQYYKMTNNEQLESAQASSLGVPLHDVVISSVGQADDVFLSTNNLNSLNNLLYLTKQYCSKYKVSLVPEKTKLQLFLPSFLSIYEDYFRCDNFLSIDSMKVDFVEETEHVGIIRSVHDNYPHLLNRVSSYKKALAAVLHVGLARNHRGNPAASLRVLQVRALPVLTSGVASLVLSKPEANIIESTVLASLLGIQKLITKTPQPVVFFLAGSLPGTALLHLRQLSLFGMITRLPGSIISSVARNALVCENPLSRSWFHQIRVICLQYALPSPLSLLDFPPTKYTYKSLVKRHVQAYWEDVLRQEASQLPSLEYFHPRVMSLSSPHPLWTTAGSNPFEISKAVIQARMLSGRYPSDYLARHWTKNKSGHCLLPLCSGCETPGTLEHILLYCPSLAQCRQKVLKLSSILSSEDQMTKTILQTIFEDPGNLLMQFLLDCSALPHIQDAVHLNGPQLLDSLFRISRTWCYSVHRTRCSMLGLWSFR